MPLVGQSKVIILFNDPLKIISSYAYIYRYKLSFALFQNCNHIGYAFTAAGQWRFFDTNNPPAPQALKINLD
jgi:hypothetical protein